MREEPIAPEPKLAASEALGTSKSTALAAGIAVLLIALGALGSNALTPVTAGDRVSGSETARLVDGFSKASGALMPVDLSTETERGALYRSLSLTKPQAQRLFAMVERGERALGWLSLWDNYDEDGDIASVTAGGMTQRVVLARAPIRILVPYIPGQPVFITGERDGMGGGVTLAVELSTGPLPLPPLAVGQTVMLPVQ